MRKFKCEVVTTNTYIVEIDENIINEEWMDHYSKYFYEIDTIREHAANVAWHRNSFRNYDFEGYGYVGEANLDMSAEELKKKGITIRVISEDEEIEVEAMEVK
ncbi:hypothetical protein [Paenibacillus sp. FSL H3-0333]|uniref:hypothetical protein n=1 Tax=Paenibacillus sp. FSL H3-0333 TaxID=2921373 RepID=UPI0030FB4C26